MNTMPKGCLLKLQHAKQNILFCIEKKKFTQKKEKLNIYKHFTVGVSMVQSMVGNPNRQLYKFLPSNRMPIAIHNLCTIEYTREWWLVGGVYNSFVFLLILSKFCVNFVTVFIFQTEISSYFPKLLKVSL